MGTTGTIQESSQQALAGHQLAGHILSTRCLAGERDKLSIVFTAALIQLQPALLLLLKVETWRRRPSNAVHRLIRHMNWDLDAIETVVHDNTKLVIETMRTISWTWTLLI